MRPRYNQILNSGKLGQFKSRPLSYQVHFGKAEKDSGALVGTLEYSGEKADTFFWTCSKIYAELQLKFVRITRQTRT